MSHNPAGFREHEHTADWELEVWAPDLAGLLEQAALGMYTLAGVRLEPSTRQQSHIQLSAYDAESLLVAFLQELLYLSETQGLGFDQFDIELRDFQLDARLQGSAIASLHKEIKAVTYHNLRITESESGLRVRIVFDV
jgi:SHS2 domain-containing protein